MTTSSIAHLGAVGEPAAGAEPVPTPPKRGRLLVVFGFALLLLAWTWTIPPGGSPDEMDHYVRALAVGQGDLHGAPNPQLSSPDWQQDPPKTCCEPGNATALHWIALGVRYVRIPAALAPEKLTCRTAPYTGRPPCDRTKPATGTVVVHTTMGTLEPLPYLLPGLAARLGTNADQALRLAKLANALFCAALLAVAVTALWPRVDEPMLAVAGLLGAVTPMVFFVGTTPAPSAIEITSAIAFFAVLLRVTRSEPAPRWCWVTLALVGAVLATSRALGPVWIVGDVAVVVALRGPRVIGSLLARNRRAAAAAAAVGSAVATTVFWELRYQPHVPFDYGFFHGQIRPTLQRLHQIFQELIGQFGQADLHLSDTNYLLWVVAVAALAGAALWSARNKDRLLIVADCVAVVVAAILVSAAIMRQDGFDMQGRHILAFAATAPLLTGEIAYGGAARLPKALRQFLAPAVAAVTGVAHLSAMVRAGHQYGWLGRQSPTNWTPPGSASAWIGVTVLALGLVLVGVVQGALTARPRPEVVHHNRRDLAAV
jgi:Predicted membrane protein (DUF2142)